MRLQNHVRNEFYKCDSPENTLNRILSGLDRLGLKADYAGVRATDQLFWGRVWIDSLHLVCEGKGVKRELAQASAYAELVERLSAGLYYPAFEEQVRFHLPALYDAKTQAFLNYQWMEGYVQAHQEELEGNVLRIEDLLQRQTNLRTSDLQEIKDCEMASHWVDGYSLLQEARIKVPMTFVAYIHGTNGIAAGNVPEEALIQACCEIFERSAQIQAVTKAMTIPSIDPATVDHPDFASVHDFYTRQNIQMTLKDLSFDSGFPVLGIVYTNHNLPADRLEHRTFIAGASMHSHEALSRCFTEGIQGRKTLKASRPQLDQPVQPRSQVDSYYMLMKCGVAPTDLGFLEQGEMRPFVSASASDLMQEIQALKEVCRCLGTDCILLDHTHPVLEFPVVRVVIPGVSDFLPFLPADILTNESTKPSTAWKGEEYKRIAQSFFA